MQPTWLVITSRYNVDVSDHFWRFGSLTRSWRLMDLRDQIVGLPLGFCCRDHSTAPLQNLQWWKIQWRPKIGHVRQKISSEGAENRPIVFRWIPALLFIAALGLVALGSTIFWFVPFSAFWSFQYFARWLTSMNFYLTTGDVISGSWSTVQGRDGWRINELGRSLLK